MVLRVPTSAGSTLGKWQETVGARGSCLLPRLHIPLFKPLGGEKSSKALGVAQMYGSWLVLPAHISVGKDY